MNYKLSYPAINGETVTQGHADYCKAEGHGTHTVNGVVSPLCPRCGEGNQMSEQLYRVTYTTSGLRRRTKTVTAETLAYLKSAWYNGIRVTSSRKATEAETARGEFKGALNA